MLRQQRADPSALFSASCQPGSIFAGYLEVGTSFYRGNQGQTRLSAVFCSRSFLQPFHNSWLSSLKPHLMCVKLVAALAPKICVWIPCVLPEWAIDAAFHTTEQYLSGASSVVSLQWIYSHFCNRKQELNVWKEENVWSEWEMQILSSSAKLLISLRSVSGQLSCVVLPIKYLLLNKAKLREDYGGDYGLLFSVWFVGFFV